MTADEVTRGDRGTGSPGGEAEDVSDPILEAQEELAAARQIVAVVTKEHRRISRDLHDNVGGALYALRLMATNLAAVLRTKGIEEANQAEMLEEQAAEAQRQLRFAIKGVYPREVDADGLPKALERLASQVRDRYGIRCEARAPENLVLPNHDMAGALLKIAQQACQNASKYGQPKFISMVVRPEAEGFRLVVENDGLPYRIDESDSVTGIGLAIMRTRARAVSGNFLIEARPGGGTRVEVFLPRPRGARIPTTPATQRSTT